MEEKTILNHIKDLRRTLIAGLVILAAAFIGGYLMYPLTVHFLSAPLDGIRDRASSELSMTALTIFEGFILRLKTAFVSGVILSLPFQIANIFVFIGPGLKAGERNMLLFSAACGSVLAIGAVLYAYYFIVPLSVAFLTSDSFIPGGIRLMPVYEKNVTYIIQFLLAGAVIFQLPVILFGLLRWRIVSLSSALKASRFVIVGAFVCSAVLSPPDVLSQILLALPLIVLYFVTLGLHVLTGGRRT